MKERNDKEFNKRFEELCSVISNFENKKNLKKFLEDLCTPAELIALSDRWEVALRIHDGQSYREIQEEAQVSTTTVTRVGRSLRFGQGYQLALKKRGPLK